MEFGIEVFDFCLEFGDSSLGVVAGKHGGLVLKQAEEGLSFELVSTVKG